MALTISDSSIIVLDEIVFHPAVHLVQHVVIGQFVTSHLIGHPVEARHRVTHCQLKTNKLKLLYITYICNIVTVKYVKLLIATVVSTQVIINISKYLPPRTSVI
jgi:hypothetical protein